MKAWTGYAGIALLVAVGGSVVAWFAAPPAAASGIRFAAILAWALQVAAFALLVRLRAKPTMFLLGFVLGIALRFLAVGLVAVWVTRTNAYPPAPTLVGLVGFVFLMLMLEPLFLRKGLPAA